MSTIPLAKGFSEKHLKWPVLISIKYDGVPVRIDIDAEGNHTIRTRQGKDVPSVRTLVQEFVDRYISDERDHDDVVTPITLVGEVVQHENRFADFKQTSGIVRKQDDQSHRLALLLFECDVQDTFIERHQFMEDFIAHIHGRVHVIPQIACENMDQLLSHQTKVLDYWPEAEGMVARNHDDPFAPGKRSWGYQKLLQEPTIDLRIVDFEEATAEDGTPKGMVGRLVALYNGKKIGIGPGRLTHKERIALWEAKVAHIEKHGPSDYYVNGTSIAQIKYKKDDSYDALRQPTFQHWRDDKETPDA